MNILSTTQALNSHQMVTLDHGTFRRATMSERFKAVFCPGFKQKQVQAIADRVMEQLRSGQDQEASLELANAFIARYQHDKKASKISQAVDRLAVLYRKDGKFTHDANSAALAKWTRYGQDESLYINHPEFCSFVESSGLLSQIKVTRDTFREIDGEAAIFVDGEWMKWSIFREQFEAVYSQRYRETFIVCKQTSNVFTYLDNGRGLQPHHPYLTEMNPTSVLNEEDFGKVLDKARQFVRKGEEALGADEQAHLNNDRTFVIQLVTSHVNGPDTRLHNLTLKPKHPYLRLIVGQDNAELGTHKGEVYEVGYGWKEKAKMPLKSGEGRFRSPDVWEYMSSDEKVVTNIAVTRDEAKALLDYGSKYHRSEVNLGNPIGFHLAKQNCSTFIRSALNAAGIVVPTEITLKNLWNEVCPQIIHTAIEALRLASSSIYDLGDRVISALPEKFRLKVKSTVKKIAQVVWRGFEAITALPFAPLKVALGDASGKGGIAFVAPGEEPHMIKPGLKTKNGWFSFSSYVVNLPGILQRWQREQASTVIYKRQTKLCIVP